MEAINSLASTAAKTIWGDNPQKQNEEPVSGKQGDTSKGEPYDAGNIEPTETSTATTNTTNASNTTQTTDPTDTTQATNPTDTTTHTDTTTTKTDGPNPAKIKDSSNMPGDSTKAQNDTRSPSSEEEATVPPEDLKGPGPRPVAELAKEHGGNAGAVSHGTSKGSGMLDGSDVPASQPTETSPGTSASNVTKPEGISAESKNAHAEKKEEEDGTGEQYVKSSGLEADGGDFDATKPGAGREADRLLEEKGIHPVVGKKPAAEPATTTHDKSHAAAPAPTSHEAKEKKSLSERIKAKLHHKSAAT